MNSAIVPPGRNNIVPALPGGTGQDYEEPYSHMQNRAVGQPEENYKRDEVPLGNVKTTVYNEEEGAPADVEDGTVEMKEYDSADDENGTVPRSG